MKTRTRTIEVSDGGVLDEIGTYSVDACDMSFIFDILRNNMYASAPRAVSQEISSNARDANREFQRERALADGLTLDEYREQRGVGQEYCERPIEVKLPNKADPTFYIRDFGVGITRDRMVNVFLKYAASTKRAENDETGGFGLGAKTPFAYSEMFTIVTVTNEGEGGSLIKNTYVSFIDESERGKINLVNQSPLSPDEYQGTGTTIVLNCKPGDESSFKRWIINTCKYWPVKPEVKGDAGFAWEEYDTIYKGDGWYILDRQKTHYGNYDDEFNKALALCDGIPYEIRPEYIFKDDEMEDSMKNLFKFPLRLDCEIGEVALNTSREDIKYTNGTVNRLKIRLLGVLRELKAKMQKEISSCSSYWDAQFEWNRLKKLQNNILTECYWKAPNGENLKVDGKAVGVGSKYPGLQMKKFTRQTDGSRPKMSQESHWTFDGKKALLVLDDTGNKVPSKGRIVTLMNQHPNVDIIYAITIQDWASGIDPANQNYQSGQTSWNNLWKDHHLAYSNVIRLSNVDIVKAPRQPKVKGSSATIKIKEYRRNSHSHTWGRMWRDTRDDEIKLNDVGRVYVILYAREAYLPTSFNLDTKSGKWVTNGDIRNVAAMMPKGETIYGVSYRWANKLGKGWIPLETYAKKQIEKITQDPSLQNISDELHDIDYTIFNSFNYVGGIVNQAEFLKLIDNPNSTMIKYLTLSNQLNTVSSKREKLAQLQRIVGGSLDKDGNPCETRIKKLHDEFKETYPLFTHVDNWQLRNFPLEELAFVVNAYDEQTKKKKAPRLVGAA